MFRRLVTAMLLASVAALPLAQAALAASPAIHRDTLLFSLTNVPCNGVTYDISLEGHEVVQDYGDLVRIHTLFGGRVVASDGTTLRVRHSWTETWDFNAMTLTITGMPFGAWLEGSSIRVHERGRLVIDLTTFEPIFMAGKFSGPPDPHGWTCQLIAAAG